MFYGKVLSGALFCGNVLTPDRFCDNESSGDLLRCNVLTGDLSCARALSGGLFKRLLLLSGHCPRLYLLSALVYKTELLSEHSKRNSERIFILKEQSSDLRIVTEHSTCRNIDLFTDRSYVQKQSDERSYVLCHFTDRSGYFPSSRVNKSYLPGC